MVRFPSRGLLAINATCEFLLPTDPQPVRNAAGELPRGVPQGGLTVLGTFAAHIQPLTQRDRLELGVKEVLGAQQEKRAIHVTVPSPSILDNALDNIAGALVRIIGESDGRNRGAGYRVFSMHVLTGHHVEMVIIN